MNALPEWRRHGACRDQPTRLFFPHGLEAGGADVNTVEQREALAVCATCPVLLDCRTWAINHEMYGVWGGTTEKERKRLRRALGITVDQHPDPTAGLDNDEKAKRAVHLFRQGWRAAEIAAELGTYVKQVHRWLSAGGVDAYPPPDGRAARRRHEDRVRSRTA